jgi:hypothetical protein
MPEGGRPHGGADRVSRLIQATSLREDVLNQHPVLRQQERVGSAAT